MKKVLVTFVLVCIAAITVLAKPNKDREFILKLGFQPLNTISEEFQGNSTSQNTKLGISAGLEYFQYLSNVAALGLGTSYDFPRKTNDNARNVSFMPLFAALKLRTPLSGLDNTFMFCSGRIGGVIPILSNLDEATQKTGFYYGGGIGFSINSLVIEAIYAINNYTVSSPMNAGTINCSCQTITLYAGYKFDI
ncbi:MAG: hypothetical protein LBJ79_02175 [Endomicrobium sp.]|nr:hypothetical protein [Endomicrobium sp.]